MAVGHSSQTWRQKPMGQSVIADKSMLKRGNMILRSKRRLKPEARPPASTVAPRVSDADDYKEALELAYPLAVESYKLTERRLEVIEKRLQDLLAFDVTITLGFIGICSGKLDFVHWAFILGIFFCLLGLGVGVYTRLEGTLMFIAPKRLYDDYLVATDAEFKLWFIGATGKNDEHNAAVIKRKARMTARIAILFLLEALLLGLWAASFRPSARPQDSGKNQQAVAPVGAAKGSPPSGSSLAPVKKGKGP